MPTAAPFWWGLFNIPEEQAGCWQIGPRTTWIENRRFEWRISQDSGFDATRTGVAVTFPFPLDQIPEASDSVLVRRFGFQHDGGALTIEPRLADRPVVARPDAPFTLPAGEQITVYLSTALWMRVSIGMPARELIELPIVRPPDTWFGPSTMVGELCYGSRTTARLSLDDQPLRPERAITAAVLRNRHDKPLLIERVSLPVPHLSLYRDVRGLLWTQSVTVELRPAGALTEVKLDEGPPEQADRPEVVQGPRVEAGRNIIIRAFGLLRG